MVKLLHTADLHIDMGRFGFVDPATGVNTAWANTAVVWNTICTTAVDQHVDALVIGGDCFRNGNPSPEAIGMFLDPLRKVVVENIPIVVLVGNHEGIGLSRRGHRDILSAILAGWPNTHIVADTRLVDLGTVQIGAAAWPLPNRVREIVDTGNLAGGEESVDAMVANELLDSLYDLTDQIDPDRPAVLAGHLTVDTASLGTDRRGSEALVHELFSEPMLPLDELDQDPWQAVLLGHIHRRQRIGERVIYAGSPDRMDWTEDSQTKAATMVTIDQPDQIADMSDVDIPARRLRSFDLATTLIPDLTGVANGDPVQIVLPPGEKQAPPEVIAALDQVGARPKVKRTIVRDVKKQKREGLGRDVNIVDGLRAWMKAKEISDGDRVRLEAAMNELLTDGTD